MGTIDEEAFARLAEFLGSAGLRPLIEVCVQDLDEAVERLSRASEAGDAVQVKRVAHMMAGVLAQYACTGPASKARALSHAAEAEALSAAGSLGSECRSAIEDLRARVASM